MKQIVTLFAMLLLAGSALYAQGGGGGAFNMGARSNTLLVNTDEGLFVMRSGVIAKFDVETLQVKHEYPLFGAMPQPPADRTDRAAMTAYNTDIQRRNAPAVMLAVKESLLVLIGDNFARINQKTFEIEATGTLAAADAPAAPGGVMAFLGEPAPTTLLEDDILYIVRQREMISLDITNGTVLARMALPADMLPRQQGVGRGGGARGGGAAGGNQAN